MRKLVLAAALAAGMAAVPGFAGETPLSVGGFTLGRPIETVADRVIMETALPVRYMENLHEVEIRVRIKLKYDDGSLELFQELLRRFKKKYGEPTDYMGDPCRVFISWKWSFTGADGIRVSLTLQHNQQDEDEKMGNAVKLTLHNRLEDDARCFKENRLERRAALRQRAAPSGKAATPDWDLFVPK